MENEKKKKLAKIFGIIASVLVVAAFVFAILSEGFKSCSREKTQECDTVQMADTNMMCETDTTVVVQH